MREAELTPSFSVQSKVLKASEAKEQGSQEAGPGPRSLTHSLYLLTAVWSLWMCKSASVMTSWLHLVLEARPTWTGCSTLVSLPKDAELRAGPGCSGWLLTGPTGGAAGCADSLLWTAH